MVKKTIEKICRVCRNNKDVITVHVYPHVLSKIVGKSRKEFICIDCIGSWNKVLYRTTEDFYSYVDSIVDSLDNWWGKNDKENL